jgi:hypothetical protein
MPVVNLIVRVVGYYTLQFCDYFMCGPIGRREIFLTSSLLVEIEGHFSLEFVNYVCETEGRRRLHGPKASAIHHGSGK